MRHVGQEVPTAIPVATDHRHAFLELVGHRVELHRQRRELVVEVVRDRAHGRIRLAHQRKHCVLVAHVERREDQPLARVRRQERRQMVGVQIGETDFLYIWILQ
jgi:hypothetical protein